MDREKMLTQAAEHAEHVARALQDAWGRHVDELDEDGKDEEQFPQLLGLLIGGRQWFSEFRALEARAVAAMDVAGFISSDQYLAMCRLANIVGRMRIDSVTAQVDREATPTKTSPDEHAEIRSEGPAT